MTSPPSDKPKVLLVSPTLERGGAEHMVVELAKGLTREGIACAVCYLDGRGTLAPEIAAVGVSVRSLALPHKAWPAQFRLRRELRGFQPDVIHAHMPRAAFWAAAAKQADLPLVYTEHNVQPVYPGWTSRLFRYFLPRTSHVIAVSHEGADSFVGRRPVDKGKVTIIPTGVPLADLRAATTPEELRAQHGITNEHLICAVGAVRPPKAYHFLARAVRLLVDRSLPVRCLIVGTTTVVPAEATRVQEEIRALGLEGIVQVTGEVASAFDYIAAGELLVLSSIHEGLPRVILEGMAAGKPVVTTNVGGCAEAVVDGETGIVVPPENPEALAAALKYVLTHPDEARQMGEAGRRRVEEHFTIEAMVRRHIEVYEQVIADCRRV